MNDWDEIMKKSKYFWLGFLSILCPLFLVFSFYQKKRVFGAALLVFIALSYLFFAIGGDKSIYIKMNCILFFAFIIRETGPEGLKEQFAKVRIAASFTMLVSPFYILAYRPTTIAEIAFSFLIILTSEYILWRNE